MWKVYFKVIITGMQKRWGGDGFKQDRGSREKQIN
jgi:hypothetical protein